MLARFSFTAMLVAGLVIFSGATRIVEVSPVKPAVAGVAPRAEPDAANWDIAVLDTAASVPYLSAVEKDVILETNKARANPALYAKLYIAPLLTRFNGKILSRPGDLDLQTVEGKSAVQSCIAALNQTGRISPLAPEKGLSRGAHDHVQDQGRTGKTGHHGSDGSDFQQRIKRYGAGYNLAGENISYGPATGREIVIQLLVDDGVPSRGHRENLFNPQYTQIGAAVGKHSRYEVMCVIEYANGYISK